MNDTYDLNRREVPGYPNYQICELGRVYNTETGVEMNVSKGWDGYLKYKLRYNKKQHNVFLHRILALIFIANPNNYEFVDHIDRNRLNNSLNNLRWATRSQNARNTSLSNKNTSSVKGVYIHKYKNYICWTARIHNDNHERISKNFPHTEEGFEQAVAWRRAKEVEFNYTQV